MDILEKRWNKIKNMRLEHYSSDKFRREVIDIVGRYLDLSQNKIFFFGSRVAGKGNE